MRDKAPLPPGRAWSGMTAYLGGMDVPIPTEGRDERYTRSCRSIERSAETFLKNVGNHQRVRNIKG